MAHLHFMEHGTSEFWIAVAPDGEIRFDHQMSGEHSTFTGFTLSVDEARQLRDALTDAIAAADIDPPLDQ